MKRDSNWSAEVHTKVMIDAFGVDMGRAMILPSITQDLAHGDDNRMHFLRDPGQSPSKAIANYREYVQEEFDTARSLNATGDSDNRAAALNFFTFAVHDILDSFSPAHNHMGDPQVFDKTWGAAEAEKHGHSPSDLVGQEGTAHLTPKVEKSMIKELKKAFDYVYRKGQKPDLTIRNNRRDNCAETVSCKSGSEIEFWN